MNIRDYDNIPKILTTPNFPSVMPITLYAWTLLMTKIMDHCESWMAKIYSGLKYGERTGKTAEADSLRSELTSTAHHISISDPFHFGLRSIWEAQITFDKWSPDSVTWLASTNVQFSIRSHLLTGHPSDSKENMEEEWTEQDMRERVHVWHIRSPDTFKNVLSIIKDEKQSRDTSIKLKLNFEMDVLTPELLIKVQWSVAKESIRLQSWSHWKHLCICLKACWALWRNNICRGHGLAFAKQNENRV